MIHSVFTLPSVRTSAGPGSLPVEVTQTFIPEGSGPLEILPETSCCNFPLTLITVLRDSLRDFLYPSHTLPGKISECHEHGHIAIFHFL